MREEVGQTETAGQCGIAEGVVEVDMGVDDDHRQAGDGAHRIGQSDGLRRTRQGVDQQRVLLSEDQRAVDVQHGVTQDVDAVAHRYKGDHRAKPRDEATQGVTDRPRSGGGAAHDVLW